MIRLQLTRRCASLLTLAAICLAATALPAQATYYKKADLGKFRIVSGRFNQTVQYLADSTAASGAFAGTNCYLYHYTDKGDATYKLTAVPGDDIAASELLGDEFSFIGVHWSGTVARHWDGQEATSDGPSYDASDCGQPLPGTQSNSDCGIKHVRDVPGPSWTTYQGGQVTSSGDTGEIGPFSAITPKDPLDGCPTDSSYGVEPLIAPSRFSPKRLGELSVGDRIKLSGKASDSSLKSISWLGEQGRQGSVRAELSWDLVIEKVSRK